MKTYLVEAYNQELKFEKDSNIIAVTPEVCYELDKAGIEYSILEDYFSSAEILKEDNGYFDSQLSWFDEFDEFLFEVFPQAKKTKLKLAKQYYLFLKTMMDPIISRSKVLFGFIESTKPSNIIYVSNEWKEETIDFTLLFWKEHQSLFSRLAPMICQKCSIPFSRIIVKERMNVGAHSRSISFIDSLKEKLKRNKYLKNIYLSWKLKLVSGIFPRLFKQNGLAILLLKRGYGIDGLIKDAIRYGHRIFIKSDGQILHYLPFGIRKYWKIKKNNKYAKMAPEFEGNWKRIAKCLNNRTEILNWLNKNCGIDVSNIILPRLQYFIENICPEIFSLIDGYIKFYDNKNIDFVITPHQWHPDEYAAIAATRYSKNTKSVCIQHGDSPSVCNFWDISELWPYDIYFATDEEIADYFKKRVNQYSNCATQVVASSSYRLRNLKRSNRLKRSRKKTVVYVPTFFDWDAFQVDKITSIHRDAWYYRWQKALLEYFASRRDFYFIWKALPASNKIYDPIPNVILDKKHKNIKYATNSFIQWIRHADIVLFDYPSTALYEAAVAKLPVFSLYEVSLPIRDSALKLFGKSLQPFGSIREGIGKVKKFLDADHGDFLVSFTLPKVSILDSLEHLQERTKGAKRQAGKS